ncbi:MAG: 23S rRNA (uracil(1939)-C(5))-methyltransferase RlmD [candidate division Zixibacteria bacterium]|nr:23S rRNA (uracil(1939)-C(5))-methyltransferase RlmD [candidate division Zixibacteria bacterium]
MENKLIELKIIDLAFNGKSVAHLDGKVIFLKGGLPGEKVLAEITRTKPRYNEGIVRKIITKSELRITAPCSHFDVCGGCVWQDLEYKNQLEFKRKQVSDCLERIGKMDDVKLHNVVGSSKLFHYRNKMEFSFHVTGKDNFNLGLHHRGRFDEIFDLQKCFLQSDTANQIVRFIRDFVKRHRIPAYDIMNHTGFMRFLVIREAHKTGQIMVNLVTNKGNIPNQSELISEMKVSFPQVKTLIQNETSRKSNVAVGEKEHILFGAGFIEEEILGCRLRIRANSFFQTNSIQTEILYRTAFDLLLPQKSDRILDLYCGTGSIGILISKYVKEVVGVELVANAVVDARENALENGIKNIEFVEADVKDFLRSEAVDGEPFDTVIVDPPRAGVNPKALRRIIRLQPSKILYISCNPATFARDAATLFEAGYRLPEVRPIDMFPHTMHIELVGIFYFD